MTRSLVLSLAISSLSLTASSQGPSDTLVLEGGTVIDGTGAASIRDAIVVIQGNRIQAVGPRGRVSVPPNATRIPAEGKFLIPGLIDGHVHYWDWFGELLLAHGVTTVLDLGNYSDYMVALAGSIEKGMDVGPRIFAAGEFLCAVPAAAGRGTRSGGGDRRSEIRVLQAQAFLEDEQQARKKVQELVAKGMKVVKAFQNLSPAQLAAIADEAHKLGVPVSGHSRDALASIAAGQDQLVHESSVISGAIKNAANRRAYEEQTAPCSASLMDSEGMDALVALMVKRGVHYNPTFVSRYKMFSKRATEHELATVRLFARNTLQYVPIDVREGILSSFRRLRNELRATDPPSAGFQSVDTMTPKELEAHRRCYASSQDFVRRFVAAGGILNAGTDTPSTSVPGAGLHHELEILVEAGLTPMQALQAATVNTAKYLRMEKDLGTIEAGKLADLVVLDADPLVNISNTQKIHSVIKNGKLVDRSFHREYRPHHQAADGYGDHGLARAVSTQHVRVEGHD